jgi:hypothetical protein
LFIERKFLHWTEGLQFFLFFIRTLIVRILHQAEEIDKLTSANQRLTAELNEMKVLDAGLQKLIYLSRERVRLFRFWWR